MLTKLATSSFWNSWGLMIARLIIVVQFVIAFWFKFAGMDGTAEYIASVGLPFPLVLAWLAALFEVWVAIAFLTGIKFRETALVTLAYVLVLGFLFHGPSHWGANMDEFGFFIDHFVMVAGLLFMIAHGTGNSWKLKLGK